MLKSFHIPGIIEAGCDEAGRGCLAGPVFAAAVILPPDFSNDILNDSKQMTEKQRYQIREVIEREALAWAVAKATPEEIDKINIRNASFLAMHRAVAKLKIKPQALLIDGNGFNPYKKFPHHCIIKGDGIYYSIAAASVLAKTYRDDHMLKLHKKHKHYDWKSNKGYPTAHHRDAIKIYGITDFHRKSFKLEGEDQLKLNFID
jgi:ribonuclease HII